MTVQDLLEELKKLNNSNVNYDKTVDTVKCGDISRTVTKVGVTMFATADIIRQAAERGMELLITHEPTFYGDKETVLADDPVMTAKQTLLKESNIVLYRYHDHPHAMPEDMIDNGTIYASGLKGTITGKPYWAVTGFALDEAMSARRIAETMEKNLKTRHIRIAGAMDVPGRKIAFACGTPGHIRECLQSPEWDFVVTGEICEWGDGEYARDLAQLGGGKAILVLGHCISERAGMEYLAELLQEKHPELQVSYLECGDVYNFTV
ncbi:MAG: Nif3-like dinuclear metal center hexameric protein [Lentisphaeria bacterium]|nr:Nif3-like dinuclear metal center hexameric protein [Lentisphaeria bacterium]